MTNKNNKYLSFDKIGALLIIISILVDSLTSHNSIYSANSENLYLSTKYQLFTGLFLLLFSSSNLYKQSLRLILIGVLIFTLTIQLGIFTGTNLGFITPIGGSIMIIGWFIFLFQYFR